MATTSRPGSPRRGRRSPITPNRTLLWMVIGAALIVLALVLTVVLSRGATIDISQDVVTFQNLSRDHFEGAVTYEQTPPVGGAHNSAWLNCGIYDTPVPSEYAVHSLEHGAVWITYRPDLPAAGVEALRDQVRDRGFIVLSPFEGLPTPVVASAWGVQLLLDGVDDPRLGAFIQTYRQGPQTPEPGARCTGGVGIPVDR